MMSTVEGIEAFVARGIAAQDAADRAAGRLTSFESDRENIIGLLRVRLERELSEAIEMTRRAAATLAELISDGIYDVEYAETDTGRDVEHFVVDARRCLSAAWAQAIR